MATNGVSRSGNLHLTDGRKTVRKRPKGLTSGLSHGQLQTIFKALSSPRSPPWNIAQGKPLSQTPLSPRSPRRNGMHASQSHSHLPTESAIPKSPNAQPASALSLGSPEPLSPTSPIISPRPRAVTALPPMSPRESAVTEKRNPVEIEQLDPEYFKALISPESKVEPPSSVPADIDQIQALIKTAYGELNKVLIRDTSKQAKEHRKNIIRQRAEINIFWKKLDRAIYSVGKDKQPQKELAEAHLRTLYLACDRFLKKYGAVQIPKPPVELLTPRGRSMTDAKSRSALNKAHGEFRDKVRHSQNLQDAAIRQCTADILVLASAYNEKPKKSPVVNPPIPSVGRRILDAAQKILSPRGKKIREYRF